MINRLPGERWRPVAERGFEEAYLVSDHGRVYSLSRIVQYRDRDAARAGRILKNRKGSHTDHRSVILHHRGNSRKVGVHILVLAAFVGPCPEGMECLHWDDDPNNNHVSNLRWGTRSENVFDKIRNGRHPMASKTACINGHEFTPENTYVRRDGLGKRSCITCMHERTRQWRKERRNLKSKELQWVS